MRYLRSCIVVLLCGGEAMHCSKMGALYYAAGRGENRLRQNFHKLYVDIIRECTGLFTSEIVPQSAL